MAKIKKSKQNTNKKQPLKKSARDKTKFAGLKPHFSLKRRADLLDFDYINKLNDKEKAWLNAFIEEEVHSKFNHDGRKLNKTKKAKRKIYNANNARNRCIFTRAKASHLLDTLYDSNDYQNQIGGDLLDLVEKVEDFQDTLDSADKSKNTSQK